MKELDALKTIMSELDSDDIVLFTTGMISREAQSISDRPNNFYMIGSMGLLSSVGLGMSLNSKKKIVVIDGDGALLMDMGTMALIAFEKPKNLIHIVIDNGSYCSTGRQPTISREVSLDKIARAAGYKTVKKVSSLSQMKNLLKSAGPAFILLKVKADPGLEPPRIKATPVELKNRMMRSFK